MNLAEIMSSSWYEDGQEVGMKLGKKRPRYLVQSFAWPLMISMIMDIDLSFPPNGDYLRCTYQFLIGQKVNKIRIATNLIIV